MQRFTYAVMVAQVKCKRWEKQSHWGNNIWKMECLLHHIGRLVMIYEITYFFIPTLRSDIRASHFRVFLSNLNASSIIAINVLSLRRVGIALNCKKNLQARAHYSLERITLATTETANTAVIFHSHYNFFSQLQPFLEQFYNWAKIFTTIIRKIICSCSVQGSLQKNGNQTNKTLRWVGWDGWKIVICHFHRH